MREGIFLFAFLLLIYGVGNAFSDTKKIEKDVFINLTSWAVQFFDRKYFNTSRMIKGSSRGFGSVRMDISCEKGKGFFYLLIKQSSVVKKVSRRYRVAAADYFGKNVCEDGVSYKMVASFSPEDLYSDPITGAKCGDYYYNLCLYKYKKGRLESYRCFKHKKPVSYCFKRK